MLAAARGDTRAAAMLLRAGADPDSTTESGHTALMLACIHGRAGSARALLQAGADVRRTTRGGHTAAGYAVHYAQRHALRVLLDFERGGQALVPPALRHRARQVLRPVRRRERGRRWPSLGRWLVRRSFAGSARATRHGITVGVLPREGEDVSGLHARIGAALDLLAARDRRRLVRLARDCEGILVLPWQRGAAGYDPVSALCLLHPAEVSDPRATPATLAATLVHEATHARLFRLGFGYRGAVQRIRIERACYRAELAFAARVDDRIQLEGLIEEALLGLPSVYGRRGGSRRRL